MFSTERPLLWLTDTETVGLKPPDNGGSGVVEFAGVLLNPVTLEIEQEIHSLVNPGCEIAEQASAVHGIYAKDVEGKPTLQELFKVESAALNVGHNSIFDVKFLKPCYTKLEGQLCTLKLARQLVTDSANHKLGTLVEHLKLQTHTAHSALGDVYMTHQLLKALVEMSGRDVWDIIKAQNQPKLVLKMPFGLHKGKTIGQLPKDYLEWLISLEDLSSDLRYSVNKALELK